MAVTAPPGVPRANLAVNINDYLGVAADVPAAIQAAITAATAAGTKGGTVNCRPGTTLTYGTATVPPVIPKNLPDKLIIDLCGATIETSNTCRRAFDFPLTTPTAGDVYGNLELCNFTVDASAITVNANVQHGIIGMCNNSGHGGANALEVNVRDIEIHHVTGTGGPTLDTVAGQFFWIYLHGTSYYNDTQRRIERIRIHDVKFDGGDVGVSVRSIVRSGSAQNYANYWIEDIEVENWRHVPTETTPTAFLAQNHIVIGSRAAGGRNIRIGRGYGKNCADVGIETNLDATVELCEVEDSYNSCFYWHTFGPVTVRNLHFTRYKKCIGRRNNFVAASPTSGYPYGQGFGWMAVTDSDWGAPFPVYLEDCSWEQSAAQAWDKRASFLYCNDVPAIHIRNQRVAESGWDNSLASGATLASLMHIDNSTMATYTFLKVRDMEVVLSGSMPAANAKDVTWVSINCARGTFHGDVDGIEYDIANVTNAPTGFSKGISLGDHNTARSGADGATLYSFAARRCVYRNTAASGCRHITVKSSTYTTIPTSTPSGGTQIVVENSDLIASPSSTHLVFETSSQAAYGRSRRNVWASKRSPYTAQGITPGASPYSWQNTKLQQALVQVSGGTVSKIELSTNPTNDAWYDITAISGATAGLFLVPPDLTLKVTYTVAPTMNYLPIEQ